VRESALFKASPFHTLTPQQLAAKAGIPDAIVKARASVAVGQLILAEGSAGTGKTVLLSSLFYDLFMEDVARDMMAGLEIELTLNPDRDYQPVKPPPRHDGTLKPAGSGFTCRETSHWWVVPETP